MPRGRPAAPIELNDDDETQLMSLANARALPHGLVQHAKIVLADDEASIAIANLLKLK